MGRTTKATKTPHKTSCACPRCGYRRRAADRTTKATIAQPLAGQRLSALEFEGALRREQLEQERAKLEASSSSSARGAGSRPSSSAAAPAGDSKFTEGAGPRPGGGGSREFSPGVPSAQGPGSPTIDDRPAGEVSIPVLVPAAAPAPVVPSGPAYRCGFCDRVIPGAAQAVHGKECPGSLAMHESARWRPVGKPAAVAVPAAPILLVRHFCGAVVPVAQRAGHICPAGTPPHAGLTCELWVAA